MVCRRFSILLVIASLASFVAAAELSAETRKADFAADPKWDGYRNRLVPDPPPRVKQDLDLAREHRSAGASFDRFGIFKSAGGGQPGRDLPGRPPVYRLAACLR